MIKIFAIISAVLFMNVLVSFSQDTPVKGPQYEITVKQISTENGTATELGKIVIELMPDVAPLHVKNFDSLVAAKAYDGTAFHRVIPNFMIQGGDPNSKSKPRNTWGMGDPSQARVKAEFNSVKHERGIVSMARSNDPNSASSQFFIMHGNSPHLDGKYTAFGKTVSGLDVVDKVVAAKRNGESPIDKIEMTVRKLK
ncbi:MAG: peptidylprolyl isomerase [Candidatus Kapabacteria bacterium]|nr:peptidylprolyl isomerase [Candidatus Kapabacteria bacterium]